MMSLYFKILSPLLANRFLNKLALNVHNNMRRSPLFSFALRQITSPAPFLVKPDSSNNLTIFIASSISLFEIIDIVVTGCQGKKIFFEFFAGTAAVNPSSMSAFLVHFLVHF